MAFNCFTYALPNQALLILFLGECRTLWGEREQAALNRCIAKALPVEVLNSLEETVTIAKHSLSWGDTTQWAITRVPPMCDRAICLRWGSNFGLTPHWTSHHH